MTNTQDQKDPVQVHSDRAELETGLDTVGAEATPPAPDAASVRSDNTHQPPSAARTRSAA